VPGLAACRRAGARVRDPPGGQRLRRRSPDWLAAHYPEAQLVRSPRNDGIAGGNNLGIRAARGRYVLLLNNDTRCGRERWRKRSRTWKPTPTRPGSAATAQSRRVVPVGYLDFHSLRQALLIVTKLGQLVRPCYPSYPPAPTVREWIG